MRTPKRWSECAYFNAYDMFVHIVHVRHLVHKEPNIFLPDNRSNICTGIHIVNKQSRTSLANWTAIETMRTMITAMNLIMIVMMTVMMMSMRLTIILMMSALRRMTETRRLSLPRWLHLSSHINCWLHHGMSACVSVAELPSFSCTVWTNTGNPLFLSLRSWLMAHTLAQICSSYNISYVWAHAVCSLVVVDWHMHSKVDTENP